MSYLTQPYDLMFRMVPLEALLILVMLQRCNVFECFQKGLHNWLMNMQKNSILSVSLKMFLAVNTTYLNRQTNSAVSLELNC